MIFNKMPNKNSSLPMEKDCYGYKNNIGCNVCRYFNMCYEINSEYNASMVALFIITIIGTIIIFTTF